MTAFLIEVKGPAYLCVSEYTGEFSWTHVAEKALRFQDRHQANAACDALAKLLPDLFCPPWCLAPEAIEHGFLTGTEPQP